MGAVKSIAGLECDNVARPRSHRRWPRYHSRSSHSDARWRVDDLVRGPYIPVANPRHDQTVRPRVIRRRPHGAVGPTQGLSQGVEDGYDSRHLEPPSRSHPSFSTKPAMNTGVPRSPSSLRRPILVKASDVCRVPPSYGLVRQLAVDPHPNVLTRHGSFLRLRTFVSVGETAFDPGGSLTNASETPTTHDPPSATLEP